MVQYGMTLRLELFVNNLSASINFYSHVLMFKIKKQKPEGYTLMTNGNACLALNLRSNLQDNHPIQLAANERPGRGVEIVLEVDDIEAIYEHVRSQNWPLSDKLQQQVWGRTDFRVIDPDGYYLRITTRA